MEKPLNLAINGVVEIPQCCVYVKTPEALKALVEKLESLGYQINSPERSVGKRASRMHRAQIWFAELIIPENKKKNRGFFESSASSTPESIIIRETWSWAPLKKTGSLSDEIFPAIGMVNDCGYYYQDGRKEFYDFHLERMRIFVENLTDIPIAEWDAMIKQAPLSGPGMIKAVSAFCQDLPAEEAWVENKPNAGNLLLGWSKVINGQARTVGEVDAMNNAAADREIREDFLRLLEH